MYKREFREKINKNAFLLTTEGTLSGFQDFLLQPIINDWPDNVTYAKACTI